MRDELIQKTLVVLDAGKGGRDLGASTKTNGGWVKEKDINIALAYILNGYLRAAGLDVLMSRYGDETLSDPRRIEIINAMKPDVIISLNMALPSVYDHCIYHYEYGNNTEIICAFLKREIEKWRFFDDHISVNRERKGIMEKTYAPCIYIALGNITKWKSHAESFADPEFLLEYAHILGYALLEGFKRVVWEKWEVPEQAAKAPPDSSVIVGKEWKSPDG